MVEKITINPTKVRAYGNIIGAKDSTDYDTYTSAITEGTDTINGEETIIYEMEDTILFRDYGTTNNHNDKWLKQNCSTFSRSDDGTTVIGSNLFVASADTTNDWSKLINFTVPFTIEFDLVSYDNTASRYIRTQISSTASQVKFNQTGHYKMIVTADGSTCTVDGVSVSTYDAQTGQSHQVLFASPNIKYKNFIIYR